MIAESDLGLLQHLKTTAFCEKSERLETINYCHKRLHHRRKTNPTFCSVTLFSKILHHIETSQSIWNANEVINLYMTWASTARQLQKGFRSVSAHYNENLIITPNGASVLSFCTSRKSQRDQFCLLTLSDTPQRVHDGSHLENVKRSILCGSTTLWA